MGNTTIANTSIGNGSPADFDFVAGGDGVPNTAMANNTIADTIPAMTGMGLERCPCMRLTDVAYPRARMVECPLGWQLDSPCVSASTGLNPDGVSISPSDGPYIPPDYAYPQTYGVGCGVHPEPGHDQCYDVSTGQPLPVEEQAAFCGQSWCWVDPANCDMDMAMTAYFAPASLAYSFATCNSTNEYTPVEGINDNLPDGVDDEDAVATNATTPNATTPNATTPAPTLTPDPSPPTIVELKFTATVQFTIPAQGDPDTPEVIAYKTGVTTAAPKPTNVTVDMMTVGIAATRRLRSGRKLDGNGGITIETAVTYTIPTGGATDAMDLASAIEDAAADALSPENVANAVEQAFAESDADASLFNVTAFRSSVSTVQVTITAPPVSEESFASKQMMPWFVLATLAAMLF